MYNNNSKYETQVYETDKTEISKNLNSYQYFKPEIPDKNTDGQFGINSQIDNKYSPVLINYINRILNQENNLLKIEVLLLIKILMCNNRPTHMNLIKTNLISINLMKNKLMKLQCLEMTH